MIKILPKFFFLLKIIIIQEKLGRHPGFARMTRAPSARHGFAIINHFYLKIRDILFLYHENRSN
jgi:hypothetical protein